MASSRRPPILFALIFLLFGAYIVLLSFGVLSYTPRAKRGIFQDPQHWQITSIGVAFFCAGIGIALQDSRRAIVQLNSLVLICAFTTPMAWVLFFSGRVEWPFKIIGGVLLLLGSGGALLSLFRLLRGCLKRPSD